MNKRLCGIFLVLALSVAALFLFPAEVIRDLNSTYFSSGGDGFKSYYGALYHVQYDTLASRTLAMNYPFGEMTAFTDNQPLITGVVRFIDRHLWNIDRYTTGMMNGGMLLAFILGALFIFLILSETKVSWWYGAISSVGIAMLSPQIARMGGHYSLSWLVWIPAMLYWMIRFDKTRSVVYVLLAGLTVWLAGKMHLYFIGFFGILTGSYWLWRFVFYKKTQTVWYRDLLYFALEFMVPVLVIQSGILLNDTVTDRTAYPFGFEVFMGHPAAVFLPSGRPWAFVPRLVKVFSHISWESLSWIGTVATAGLVVSVVRVAVLLVRKQARESNPEIGQVMLFFWISVAALFFSFGIPFVFGLETLADHLGPVRQLRALGRFAWLFYYMVNILVFASLYHKAFRNPASLTWKILSLAALVLLLYEGSWNVWGNTRNLNNRMPQLDDRENLSDANQWTHLVNAADYQAIIPVPYFHVGSENIWIDATHQVKETAMTAALKTGLPLTGVELSRTSISQTYTSYALFTEPLQRLDFPDYLPDNRPFLILKMNSYEPDEAIEWFLSGAEPVTSNGRFTLLRLPVSHIRSLHETWRNRVFREFETSRHYSMENRRVSDTSACYVFRSFDHLGSFTSLRGEGAFTLPAREWHTLYEDTLKGVPPGNKMVLSFWVNQFQKDAYLRGNIELIQKKSGEDKPTGYFYSDFFRHLAAFQDDWALVELSFETQSWDEIIQLSVRNNVLPGRKYTLDELLVRKEGTIIWEEDAKYLYRNGRRFQKRQE